MPPTLVECPACRNRISALATSCPQCGHPTDGNRHAEANVSGFGLAVATPASDTLAMTGLICGAGSIVMAFIPYVSWLTGLPAVVGIVLSAVALARVRRGVAKGWGMAVAGLVTGLIGLAMFGIAAAAVLLMTITEGT